MASAVPHSLFASAGDEPRRRRVDDAVVLGVGLATVLATAPAVGGRTTGAADAVDAFDRLLGWLDPLWRASYAGASVLCVVLLAAAVFGRRVALVRDIALAAGAAYATGAALMRVADDRWPSVADALWRVGIPAYPSLRLAIVATVVMVVAPELTRPLRYCSVVVLAFAAVAAIVLGSAYPSDALGGLALGVAIGAGVRLAFGSTAGIPHEHRVQAALEALGVAAHDVRRYEQQVDGVARYHAAGVDGPIAVAVYGRDARDAQLFARLWRQLWYRDPGPAASYTRREQVEHEMLMLLAAARAGVPVPEPVTAGTAPTGDALVVTAQPDSPRVAELDRAAVSDALLAEAWIAAATLHAARIAHGRLNASALIVGGPGGGGPGVLVTDFARASLNADGAALATDVAELLVSCALVAGEDRAVGAARAALGDEALRDALPFVQRAALSPRLRDEVRDADLDVARLREQVVALTGGEMPEIAEVRRVSVRDVVLMGLTVIAAYVLLTQLGDIGFDSLRDELADARWSWVALAFALAQLTLVTDAAATTAAVGLPLPLGPTTLLQSAVKFINLTVPSAAGKFALTLRFLERQGVERAVAVTQGSIDGVTGFVVQAAVLLVCAPLVDIDVDLGDADVSGLVWAGVAVLVGGVVAAAVVAVVPGLRRRVWPVVHAALANVRELVASPERLSRLLLANVGSQLLYALALGGAVRAFGAEASLAELLVVNTGVTLLGGLVPVPGGIGVSEAGLIAGLVAVGVDEPTALGATVTHRMITYYLPPIWGWASLRWLGRRGFV